MNSCTIDAGHICELCDGSPQEIHNDSVPEEWPAMISWSCPSCSNEPCRCSEESFTSARDAAAEESGAEHAESVHIGWTYCPCWKEAFPDGADWGYARAKEEIERLHRTIIPVHEEAQRLERELAEEKSQSLRTSTDEEKLRFKLTSEIARLSKKNEQLRIRLENKSIKHDEEYRKLEHIHLLTLSKLITVEKDHDELREANANCISLSLHESRLREIEKDRDDLRAHVALISGELNVAKARAEAAERVIKESQFMSTFAQIAHKRDAYKQLCGELAGALKRECYCLEELPVKCDPCLALIAHDSKIKEIENG